MMRLTGYLIATLLFLLFQTNIIPALLPYYFKPELLLILVVYLCVVEDFLRGALLSWGIGCLLDSCCGSPLGLYGATYLTVFILGHWSVQTLNTESPLLILILVFCASLINLLALGLFGVFADLQEIFVIFGQRAMFQASINVIGAYLLMLFVLQLQRRFSPKFLIPGFAHLANTHHGD